MRLLKTTVILTLSCLWLLGCAGSQMESQLQAALETQQAQATSQEEALQNRIIDLNETATKALDMMEEEANRALAELSEAQEALVRIKNQPKPQPETRIVTNTDYVEVPVKIPDGSLTAEEEQNLVDEMIASERKARDALANAAAARRELELLNIERQRLEEQLNLTPLEEYGPTGIFGVILSLIGFAIGKWRERGKFV